MRTFARYVHTAIKYDYLIDNELPRAFFFVKSEDIWLFFFKSLLWRKEIVRVNVSDQAQSVKINTVV
jgi:hypothetical protein